MAIDWWTHLIDACVAASAAIVIVLALRWPLRKLFGATPAYQAWLLVPAMIAVVLLPPIAVAHRPTVVAVMQASTDVLAAPVRHAGVQWTGVLQAVWCLGALALVLRFWRAHRSFVRGLGELTPADGLFYSASPASGPALLGLWRPKIVVPADFARRYTEQEQALIIAHERVHARRADVLVNLLQAALQCVFWFNPLVHAAARFFRADQEMACDAAVLRRHPGLLRTYAQALLKSQSFSTTAPTTVACNWRFNHPVKERFMTLQNQPRTSRRLIGRALVTAMIVGGGYAGLAARASETPGPGSYDVKITLTMGDKKVEPRVVARAGETFAIEQDGWWRGEFVITPVGEAEHTYKVKCHITDGANAAIDPVLLGRAGNVVGVSADYKDSTGKIQRYELRLAVNDVATPVAHPPK